MRPSFEACAGLRSAGRASARTRARGGGARNHALGTMAIITGGCLAVTGGWTWRVPKVTILFPAPRSLPVLVSTFFFTT